jgi:hypothetical protein
MLIPSPAFVGIELNTGRKSFTFAVLDIKLNLIAFANGKMEKVTEFLSGQNAMTVAVNSPSGLNRGIVRGKLKKKELTNAQIRQAEMRLAEFELRECGIPLTKTAASARLCPAWVQNGFELYRKLEKIGFKKYPEMDSASQFLETNPQAGFSVMAGQIPLPKTSIGGRLQRHLLLHERGIRINDPMEFFEEITRYKLSRGIWPMELLFAPEQLDALVGAYTAWLAVNKPQEVLMVGDEKEGKLVLPERELKEKYN